MHMEVNERTKKRNKRVWKTIIGKKPSHKKRSASRNVFLLLPTSSPELEFLEP